MDKNVPLSFSILAWMMLLMLLPTSFVHAQNESAPPLPPRDKLPPEAQRLRTLAISH